MKWISISANVIDVWIPGRIMQIDENMKLCEFYFEDYDS